jgi:hypothetical protein
VFSALPYIGHVTAGFLVLFDYLINLRHDNRIYTIVLCYLLEKVSKFFNYSAMLCDVPLRTIET